MIVRSPRSFRRGSPVHAYWLTRCQGFSVRGGGRVLGRVEEVVCADAVSRADVLVVRSGRLRPHAVVVAAEEVLAVVPAESTVLVAAPARKPSRAGGAAVRAARLAGAASLLMARCSWIVALVTLRLAQRLAVWLAPILRRLALATARALVRAARRARARAPALVDALRRLTA